MNKPEISVIVPVYNAEKYLSNCIKSILHQTFQNFELLLINDGSKDSSPEVCKKYQLCDNRIKLFNKENGGVSSARNYGIDKALGNWIVVVDSDDSIDENYIYDLYKNHIDENCIVFQGFKRISRIGVEAITSEFKHDILNKNNFDRLFSEHKILYCGNPFGKLFNKQHIINNNLRFNTNIDFGEDLIFVLEYIERIDKVVLISGTNYNYFIDNNGSLSSKKYSFEKEFLIFETMHNILMRNNSSWKYDINNFCLRYNAEFLFRSIFSLYRKEHKRSRTERIQILRNLKTKYQSYLANYESLGLFNWGNSLLKKDYILLYDFYTNILFFARDSFAGIWNRYQKYR